MNVSANQLRAVVCLQGRVKEMLRPCSWIAPPATKHHACSSVAAFRASWRFRKLWLAQSVVVFFFFVKATGGGWIFGFHTLASSWAGLSSKELMSNKSLLALWRDEVGCEIRNKFMTFQVLFQKLLFPPLLWNWCAQPHVHTLSLCVSSYPAVCEFLQSNNLLSIIRAHEAQDAG